MKSKLPAILLNADFYTKPRNRKWLSENGAEAVIILQSFWIASSQEAECRIKKSEVPFLSFPLLLTEEKIFAVLKSAVEVGLLEEDKQYFFNSQIVSDHNSFKTKRENYRKGRQKRDEILPESSENPDKILPESTQDYTDTDAADVSEAEVVFKPKPKAKPELEKFGDYVYLSEPEYLKFQTDLGEEVFNRCVEKLDAWVGSDPTIIRKRKGKNAAYSFRSWVINAVAEEQARGRRTGLHDPNAPNGKLTSSEKTMQAAQSFLNKMENRGY